MNRLAWIPVLSLLACSGGDDDLPPEDDTAVEGPRALTVVAEGAGTLDAAILSVWGSASDDVWMVGADDGAGPIVLHFAGDHWARKNTGTSGDLWWVWGDDEGTLFMSGAGGRVLEFDTISGAFTEHQAADPALTLFGIWGTSATDVWAVGGDITGNRNGAMIHYDGTEWTEVAQPEGDTFRNAFKVWGTASDDVWVVGTGALVTHWDGTSFTEVDPSPVYQTTTLTTVSGSDSEVIAVGGFGNAVVARTDGTGWVDDSPPPEAIAPTFNGVTVRGDTVTACGNRGALWSRDDFGWFEAYEPTSPTYDLHACWLDPDGHLWAVGGDLVALSSGHIATNADIVPFSL